MSAVDTTGAGRRASGGPVDRPRGSTAWWAGWRSALRLARRDISKHRGRAALVLLLVGLPVMLIGFGATVLATRSVSPQESVPRLMGQADAWVPTSDTGYRIGQYADATIYSIDGRSRLQTGYRRDDPWSAQRLRQLTGGTVLETYRSQARFAIDRDRHGTTNLLGIDGRNPLTAGKVTLLSGRWPRTSDEVVVTDAGRVSGVPDSGTLTVTTADGVDHQVAIVGHGSGWYSETTPAGLIALPSAVRSWGQDRPSPDMLVDRTGGVDFAQLRKLNAYGLTVSSREVIDHPGQTDAYASAHGMVFGGSEGRALVVLIVVGVMLETSLLAGPAFAISTARQRRSFALIASNGATRVQLRRCVLVQGLLLGAFAAVAGAVLGAATAIVGSAVWARVHPGSPLGPSDVPWQQLVGLVLIASLASLVAAWLPSRGVSRLDLISVLRGRGISVRRVHAGWPIAGAIVAAVGAVFVLRTVVTHGHEFAIAGSTVVLVAGALMLIPWLLSMVGRLSTRLPLAWRLATRDVGRQRGRSAPAVAAIMASVVTLTALGIGGYSDDAQGRRDYVPQTAMGRGLLSGSGPGWQDQAQRAVADSGLRSNPLRVLGADPGPARGSTTPYVVSSRPGCSSQQSLNAEKGCGSIGSVGGLSGLNLLVLDSSALSGRLALSSAQRAVLDHGGIVGTAALHGHDGRAGFTVGQVSTGALAAHRLPLHWVSSHQVQIRVARITRARVDDAFPPGAYAGVLTPATARALGWPTSISGFDVSSPAGSISEQQEKAVTQRLDGTSSLYVERGYRASTWWIMLLFFAVIGLLVLVATVVSTALSQSEGRPDQATLASIGATVGTLRRMAMAQAVVTGLVGSVLGFAVGLVPGIAATYPLTANGSYTNAGGSVTAVNAPLILIPWVQLCAVVVGVPLLAGLIAAAMTRRSPQLTRRTE